MNLLQKSGTIVSENLGDSTAVKLDNEIITKYDDTNMQKFGAGDTMFVMDFLSHEDADLFFQNLFSPNGGKIQVSEWINLFSMIRMQPMRIIKKKYIN